MDTLEILLDRRWIIKSENKELYYKVRDELPEIRRFLTEKMGCQILENSLLVKLEKIPVLPDTCMGIEDFKDKESYAFLCILLMFLEEREAEEQFVLSQITEYVSANMPEGSVDWTLYSHRRQLIRMLRYAVSQSLIRVTDGSDVAFMDGQDGEVLYENTGASRYFMRNFSRDILTFEKPEDFMESDWFQVDEDRGIARRQRVYKRLFFSPGMYRGKDSEEDFEYLKYYGHRLKEDIESQMDCQVDIYKGSAFLLTGESNHMGTIFPGKSVLGDILLLVGSVIRERAADGTWQVQASEYIEVDRIEFENMLRDVKRKYGSGFSKNFRELTETEFIRAVLAEMYRWTFIESREEDHKIRIYPSAVRLCGTYPQNFEQTSDRKERKAT